MQELDLSWFLLGNDRVEATDDGRVTAHRLPADREAYLTEHGAMWGVRAGCPAGIRCAMVGHLSEIRCRMRVDRHCRSFGGVDLLRDGVVVGHSFRDQVQYGDDVVFTIKIQPDGNDHRWELWLPLTLAGPIAISVEGEVTPAPAENRRLLTIGDSITQGMVANGPAGSYAALLARGLGADLRNHGIGGHIFDPEIVTDTGDWKPDLVTVAYGTNDWTGGHTRERMAGNASELLTAIRCAHPEAPILMITPLWRDNETKPNPKSNQTLRYAAGGLFDLADDTITVLDGADLLPHHRRFTTDGLHPNDLGMLHVANGMLPTAERLLATTTTAV